MKLEKVEGYFDCRKYKKDTLRQNREMLKDGERINFTVAFPDEFLPEDLKDFAKKSEKTGINYVNFKIFPNNCKAYLANNQRIIFPKNSQLDGGKFLVNLSFNIKHGTGTELNGCYVNAIQFIKRTDEPFVAEEEGDVNIFNENDNPFFEKINNVNIDDESNDLPF